MTADHLGGCYFGDGDANTIMEDVWGFLLVKYNVKSMLDLGCGCGHAMRWMERFNVECLGVDGFAPAIIQKVCASPILLHDFCAGPVSLDRTFDLAWAAEFLEHVPENALPNVLQSVATARTICFTHALPGQPGKNHVNCQDDNYWIERFTEMAWGHNVAATALVRQTDRWNAPWGRKTLMIFENSRFQTLACSSGCQSQKDLLP